MTAAQHARILIGPSSFGEAHAGPLQRLVEAGCDVVPNPYKRRLSKEELLMLLADEVVGVIAGLEPYHRDVLEVSRLKVISRVGAGLSNVDLAAAKELGISVCSTPYGPTEAVAELTVGALLALLRQIPQMDRALHQGLWRKHIGAQLQGKTVAIVGFGRIGRRVAELLAPFGVHLLVVDPLVREAPRATVVSLDQALRQAEIVTLHASGEDCLLGEREIGLLKPGAYVLNVARGGVIDEVALARALDEGRVAGTWIDTFVTEPYTGPLARFEEAVLTPHVGSYTHEGRVQMETEAVENLLAALAKAGAVAQ